MTERRNINRGFKKLNVWNDSITLYQLTCKLLQNKPFEIKKVCSNTIDAAQSVCRNIAEGYCRRSIREYLKHLYISLGSLGELYTSLYSMLKANQISETEFEEIDSLHFKTENEIIKLIQSLERKEQNSEWIDKMPVA